MNKISFQLKEGKWFLVIDNKPEVKNISLIFLFRLVWELIKEEETEKLNKDSV